MIPSFRRDKPRSDCSVLEEHSDQGLHCQEQSDQGLHYLNTIYFTKITQKAQRTYIRVLEGTDVGEFCGHTWWKPENLGKTTDLGRATTTLPHADTGIRSRVAAVASECANHCAIQAPEVYTICHSSYIFWRHFTIVSPICSCFRVILQQYL